jgi:orotate phosphoribosyltransferase-like protein
MSKLHFTKEKVLELAAQGYTAEQIARRDNIDADIVKYPYLKEELMMYMEDLLSATEKPAGTEISALGKIHLKKDEDYLRLCGLTSVNGDTIDITYLVKNVERVTLYASDRDRVVANNWSLISSAQEKISEIEQILNDKNDYRQIK